MKSAVFKFLLVVGLLTITLTGCKEDSNEPLQSEFETLTQYMAQNGLDLPDILNGWVIAGSALTVDANDYSVPDYYIMDFRSAEDFATGHVKDAHNVAFADLLNEAENAGSKPILAVCYTGQTAARAVGLLRLMGYNAKSLKWGMSGWHADFEGKWNANAGDYASPNWLESGDPPANETFTSPSFATNEVNGADILEARVRAVLTKAWTVSKTDVLENPSSYFINNKWPLASWSEYGYINGAYRIDEDLNLNGLNNLDPNKQCVTYCYTGQTSAITTAWLDVLGYNGRSLMFGANGIVHSKLLVGTAGSAPKKSWKGEGSASNLNLGYYDADGVVHNPL